MINKKRLYKLFLIIMGIFLVFNFTSCNEDKTDPVEEIPEHECVFEWVIEDETVPCGEFVFYDYQCKICGKIQEVEDRKRSHVFEVTEDINATCTEDGHTTYSCVNCEYSYEEKHTATGHQHFEYVIEVEATDTKPGTRSRICSDCHEVMHTSKYVNNGYSEHGKLSVNGADLVDEKGEKFQLVGLSTHGLQWCGQFITLDTFEALHDAFGCNVIRLSLYPEEGGYATESMRNVLFNRLCTGIEACTALDMYVIIDWHMLGSNFNMPLAKEVFTKVLEKYPDQNNILFEIFNEPYGDNVSTDTCRTYANFIIPIIREKSDGIILVGGPHYSAELKGWANNPLQYSNIMYTFHFYAAGGGTPLTLKQYYNKGLPIFVSEHGGMNSDGDGDVDLDKTTEWWNIMDQYNISYVAWNISNTKGSASIFKYNTGAYTDISDSNLKTWGVLYKNHLRKVTGLDN